MHRKTETTEDSQSIEVSASDSDSDSLESVDSRDRKKKPTIHLQIKHIIDDEFENATSDMAELTKKTGIKGQIKKQSHAGSTSMRSKNNSVIKEPPKLTTKTTNTSVVSKQGGASKSTSTRV